MTTAREIQDELKPAGRRLRAAIPQVYAGYAALHGAAMGDGALPAKMKELIALAIAVTKECDGCVAAHARYKLSRKKMKPGKKKRLKSPCFLEKKKPTAFRNFPGKTPNYCCYVRDSANVSLT